MSAWKRKIADFYKRNKKILSISDPVWYKNPVVIYGLSIAPIVVVGNILKNAVALSIIMLCLVVPTFMLAGLIGKRIPYLLRVAIYALFSGVLMIPILMLVKGYFPQLIDSIGVYLPLMVVNTLTLSRCEITHTNEGVVHVFLDALYNSLGFMIIICICAFLRELVGNGSIWGRQVINWAIPGVMLPFSGLILLGMIAAFRKYTALTLHQNMTPSLNAEEKKEEQQ